jgi:hypothetical protein
VIAVENKLRAKLYNDFGEYTKYAQDRAKHSGGKKAILILLALR